MLKDSFKNELFNLKEKLEHLENMLDEKKEVIEQTIAPNNESRFKNSEDKLNDLLSTINDKIVKLNIGGKIFKVRSSTLNTYPDSLFSEALNKMNLEDDEIFFDRSYKYFKTILKFIRDKNINLKKKNRFEVEDLIEEIQFYRLDKEIILNKKREFNLEWDMGLSKPGACHVDTNDSHTLLVHSTNCYTHFCTDKLWTDEKFCVEMEYNVQQTDSYLYFGLVDEGYNYSSNCMCCSPTNATYVQCNGNIKINGRSETFDHFNFGSNKTTLGMKVDLEQKTVLFYIPDVAEAGPFTLNGSNFRIVGGHCNSGNGSITILTCYEN